jgi:nucleolar protein 14
MFKSKPKKQTKTLNPQIHQTSFHLHYLCLLHQKKKKNSAMAKTSKRSRSSSSSNTKSKKKKKNSRTAPNSVAMKASAASKDNKNSSNPFETIWSRRKFDILGKKRKGEELRIGLSRCRAIEKRKKTLLKEYEESGKSSVFLDKRIGEQNEQLGEFDKAIIRSQRERQVLKIYTIDYLFIYY